MNEFNSKLIDLAPQTLPGTSVQVAGNLLNFVLRSHLRPGDRLPSERQLADATGVGRGAIREALKALSFLGLIEVRPGGGNYVGATTSDLLPKVIEWGLLLGEKPTRDLIEARAHLEVGIARLAAERRDDADIRELERNLNEMRAAGDDAERFRRADVQFHLSLAATSRNQIFSDLLSNLHSLLDVWSSRTLAGSTDLSPYYEEHKAVFEGVRSGNGELAEAAMRKHMAAALKRIQTAMDGENE